MQAPAEKSAPAAPAKRDRLLEAATKGGVLLSSSDYTFQVETLSLMRWHAGLAEGRSCLHTRWHVSQMQSFLKMRQLRLSVACQGVPYTRILCRLLGWATWKQGRTQEEWCQAEPAGETDPDGRRMVLDWKGDPHVHQPWGQDANVTLISCLFLPPSCLSGPNAVATSPERSSMHASHKTDW